MYVRVYVVLHLGLWCVIKIVATGVRSLPGSLCRVLGCQGISGHTQNRCPTQGWGGTGVCSGEKGGRYYNATEGSRHTQGGSHRRETGVGPAPVFSEPGGCG